MAEIPSGPSSERFGALWLWSGWALPAAGWGLQLLSGQGIVEWYCNTSTGTAPETIRWILGGITVVAVAMAVLGIVLAWRAVRQTGAGSASTREGREVQRFMGVSGMLLGVLFLAIILVQGVAPLILEPCQ